MLNTFAGAPFLTIYNGSKGYINAHSKTLQCELLGRGKDVIVHVSHFRDLQQGLFANVSKSILVGKVVSGTIKIATGFAVPTSRIMAKATLDNVGLGNCVMTTYLPHLLQAKLLELLPESLAFKMLWKAIAGSLTAEEKAKML